MIMDNRFDNWYDNYVRKQQEDTKLKTIEERYEDRKRKEQKNRNDSINNRNDSMKKRNDNWIQSSSRRSQQSTMDTLANLRKIHQQRTSLQAASNSQATAVLQKGPEAVSEV